jgi:V/A-type H+-transporting ATPase subunit D
MSFTNRVTATRGSLIKLKESLELVQSGMRVLKMKRDRLADELHSLISELPRREKVEKQLMGIYKDWEVALATLGYSVVSSAAMSISRVKTKVSPISIMGLVVPKTIIEEKSKIDHIQDASLYEVAERFQTLIDELLNIAQVEASIEKIAYELMTMNRKVNALEKVIIPAYVSQIRYIEDLLFDEDLEDFVRVKHFRDVAGRKKT